MNWSETYLFGVIALVGLFTIIPLLFGLTWLSRYCKVLYRPQALFLLLLHSALVVSRWWIRTLILTCPKLRILFLLLLTCEIKAIIKVKLLFFTWRNRRNIGDYLLLLMFMILVASLGMIRGAFLRSSAIVGKNSLVSLQRGCSYVFVRHMKSLISANKLLLPIVNWVILLSYPDFWFSWRLCCRRELIRCNSGTLCLCSSFFLIVKGKVCARSFLCCESVLIGV